MRYTLILMLTVVILSGCRMGQVEGVSLSAGSFERGLWFDHDRRDYQPKGWGVKFDIVGGHMIRPVPKFWEKDTNPWKGDDPWFVLRCPMVFPYIGVSAGPVGFYAGAKTFQVKEYHRSLGRYGKWMKEEEFPSDPDGVMTYLQMSGSVRQTRWK
jgi:hypothetical protein